jgi:hypothetical protein
MMKNWNIALDWPSNPPRDDETRARLLERLQSQLEQRAPESLERIWELPPLVLEEPSGEYVALLFEARALFIAGHFYSCVAMSGIVGERLVKDLLRGSLLVGSGEEASRPSDVAFNQLERVEVSGIVGFLKEAGLLSGDGAKASRKLGELRNAYAHARGRDPKADAVKALTYLQAILEATMPMACTWETRDGITFAQTKLPAKDGTE